MNAINERYCFQCHCHWLRVWVMLFKKNNFAFFNFQPPWENEKKKNICFWSAIWNFIWFHSHIHKIHQFQEIYTYVLGICSPFLGMSSSFGSCFSGSWVGDLYKVGVPVIVDVQRSCLFGHVFQRTACFTLFTYLFIEKWPNSLELKWMAILKMMTKTNTSL